MNEFKKMLTAMVNGQAAFRAEMRKRFDELDKKFDTRINNLEQKVDKGFGEVHERLDKIGLQVARLEDDAPTREEHVVLEKRVVKIEKRIASA
jgi:hypothetical protein